MPQRFYLSQKAAANPRRAENGARRCQRLRRPAESQRDFRDDLDTSAYIPEVTPNAISAKWAKGAGGPAGDEIQNLVAIRPAQTSANGHGIAEDVAHTIDGANGQAIAHTLSADGFDASEDGPGRGTQLMASGASVRRLTPVECERLHHFPDGRTDWADGPRLRSLGIRDHKRHYPIGPDYGRRQLALVDS